MQGITDFEQLFLNDVPMVDVRAPVEFKKGAFPFAENVPLMSDSEREAVGTRYKEEGQNAAIELGHQLVNGAVKAERIAAWQNFFERHPDGVLYCFRGGLRSRISQQWLAEAGINRPFITGGYKAMRTFLLNGLHRRITQGNVLILSGPTGSGKTDVIKDWHHSIDLERLANHRGSAFGKTETDQPAQIDFENAWAIEWLKRTHTSTAPVLFEDESRLIGRVAVMPEFLALSKQANAVVLNAPFDERVARIRHDYFERAYNSQIVHGEADALRYLDDFIRSALTRIKKRLGGERYQSLLAMLDDGISSLTNQKSWLPFDGIVATLLNDYYDPMYHYQFKNKASNLVFQGNHQEILQWLADNHSS